MYWYLIFVKEDRKEYVRHLLMSEFSSNVLVPFIPMKDMLLKYSGGIKKERHMLFPGYVFVEWKLSSQEMIDRTNIIISASKDILAFFNYPDTNEIAIREHEKAELLDLFNDDHCIELSNGIKVDRNIYIQKGPLKGKESILKKVDRHKRRAYIELHFMGMARQITVGLNVKTYIPDT